MHQARWLDVQLPANGGGESSELRALAPFRSDHDDLGDLPPCLQLHNDLAEV
jgi:hypothetical protein